MEFYRYRRIVGKHLGAGVFVLTDYSVKLLVRGVTLLMCLFMSASPNVV